jgi:hypothetical protein
MKIATFGCSWSQGLSTVDDAYCWPKALAENKQYQVDNFALAGSSLSFQAYLLDDVLKHNTYDKVIFQITSPQRLTYFDDSLDYGKYLRLYNNYRELDRSGDIYRNFICITPGHLNLSKKDSFWNFPDKHDFANLHYKYTNKHISRVEYKAVVEYVKNKTDFVYFHNEDVCKIGGVPVLMNLVGDKFVADEGQHFNKQGSQWTADWILDNI